MRTTTSPVPAVTSRTLVLVVAALGAALPGQASLKSSQPTAPVADANLPADLIVVPRGKVTLGSTADKLAEITKQYWPHGPAARLKLLHQLLSEAGQRTVQVEPFRLYRVPVTNEQYLQF